MRKKRDNNASDGPSNFKTVVNAAVSESITSEVIRLVDAVCDVSASRGALRGAGLDALRAWLDPDGSDR